MSLKEKETVRIEEKDELEYPEGGRGWFVLVGTFCCLFSTYGVIQSFGIYEKYYEEKFPDVKSSQISLIGSLLSMIIYVSCVPAVSVINKIGIRATAIVGYSLMILSFMLLSLSTELYQIYLTQGVLFGLGAGLLFFVSMVSPPEYFNKRRALASGITASGSSIGGIVWPIATQRLFGQVGFAWTNRIIGFVYIPLMVISVWCIKPRLNIKRKAIPDWRVLKNPRYMVTNISTTICIMGYFPAMFYVATYASRISPPINTGIKNNILTIMNAFGFIGRTSVSWMADRWGRLNMLMITVLLTGITQLAFWLPANNTGLITTFAITYGIMCSTYTALVPATLVQLFGIEDSHSRMSFNFLMAGVGSLAGPLIAASFLPEADHDNGLEGFANMIAFTSSVIIGGALIMLGLRLWYARKVFTFI